MEFAQQRIIHDQNRRWQLKERRRREKVSPRPFASGCWSSMRFARCVQRQSVLVELMLARECKARPATEADVIAAPEVCGIGGDPEGDDTAVVTPSRTARSACPLARGGATYEVGLDIVATNCDRCMCMM